MGEIVGQAYVRNANSGSFFQEAMNRTVTLLGDPMIRMDALPPRIFEVTVDGAPFPDGGPFISDSPTATGALVAKVRDEAGLSKTDLAERSARLDDVDQGPDNFVLTNGSAGAIDLITSTFINPGDVVVAEAPTFSGSLRTFRGHIKDERRSRRG